MDVDILRDVVTWPTVLFLNKWVVKARLQWFCLSSGLSQHAI